MLCWENVDYALLATRKKPSVHMQEHQAKQSMVIKKPLIVSTFIDPRICMYRTDTERLSYDVVCLDRCRASYRTAL